MTQDDVVHYKTSTSWEPAVITQKHSAPRSYDIVTNSGNIIIRNRCHLKPTQETRPNVTLPVDGDDDIDIPVTISSSPSSSRPTQLASTVNANKGQVTEERTRSGRLVKLPP